MKRWHIFFIDVLLVLAIPLAGLLSNWMMDRIPDCIFMQHGLLCPACGGTRCVKYLSQLRPLMALRMNPYFFFTALFATGLLILLNIHAWSKGRFCAKLLKKLCAPYLLIIWAVGFAVFGILRNII